MQDRQSSERYCRDFLGFWGLGFRGSITKTPKLFQTSWPTGCLLRLHFFRSGCRIMYLFGWDDRARVTAGIQFSCAKPVLRITKTPGISLLFKKPCSEVYPLGSLEEGDSIFFACNNAGDGVDDDDTRIRFRIQAVVQAHHSGFRSFLLLPEA